MSATKKTVMVRDYEYEVESVDPTHITMKLVGSSIPWALHVAQLDGDTVKVLQEAGVLDSRKYTFAGREEAL